jgi:hypothetical protein
VPVRQWVLSLPIPLRVLLAAAGLVADEGQGGAVTLVQRFGSAANLNIHLHCLVLDGVYRCGVDGVPVMNRPAYRLLMDQGAGHRSRR